MRTWLLTLLLAVLACAAWISLSGDDQMNETARITAQLNDL